MSTLSAQTTEARPIPLITQTAVAAKLAMSPRSFAAALTDLIRRDGFPPPVVGSLESGRKGPRRKWLAEAIDEWIAGRNRVENLVMRPANDAYADTLTRDSRIL